TPGTQPSTSLIVLAGPPLNWVSGTTATAPGVRSMVVVASAVVGTVRLPAEAAEVAGAETGTEGARGAVRRPADGRAATRDGACLVVTGAVSTTTGGRDVCVCD